MTDFNDFDLSDVSKIEQIFSMVTVDKVRKVKIFVKLYDKEESEIKLRDVIVQLSEYIKTKLCDKDTNSFISEILPLTAESTTIALNQILGLESSILLLSQNSSRFALIQLFAISFLLLKFIQDNELSIVTHEEKLTDKEIEEIQNNSNELDSAVGKLFESERFTENIDVDFLGSYDGKKPN